MTVHIKPESFDPRALRISAGKVRDKDEHYIVYRGEIDETIACLERVLKAMKDFKRAVNHPKDCQACEALNKPSAGLN